MNPWVQLGLGAVELVVKVMQGARKRVVKIARMPSYKAENAEYAAKVRAEAAEKARKQ